MVLHETLPTKNNHTFLAGGDLVLYRCIATHLTGSTTFLSATQTSSTQVEAAIGHCMNQLKEVRARAPPVLADATKRQVLRFLVDDVERHNPLFRSIDATPGLEDALLDIFTEEMAEAVRGWRGLSSKSSNSTEEATEEAMDEATHKAAKAAATAKAEGRSFRVAIIGAGASGLCAAVKLKLAGIDFVVLERTKSVGGVWSVNKYPEAGCDVPSMYYSFSFAPNPSWTRHFSKAEEIHDYCNQVARHYEVLNNVQFQTKVLGASFNEKTNMWHVECTRAEDNAAAAAAARTTLIANVVITCCGQLSEPNIPPIPGKETFQGPSAHTAHWPTVANHIAGKHVAVVGTGASTMQLLRGVAAKASRVTVFQQLPGWFLPRATYHQKVDEPLRWRLRHVPMFQTYYRFRLYWQGSDGIHDALFPGDMNTTLQSMCEYSIQKSVGNDPALLQKVLPTYPPFCTRILVDNDWIKTLKLKHVELVPFQVDKILPTGIEAGGTEYTNIDTIVYSTGFKAQQFLTPMNIYGKGGLSLREHWHQQRGGTALLGITVPEFPNFFMCYGPSTNLAHGGSILFHSECQVRYIMDGIGELLNIGKDGSALECTHEAHDEYNNELAPILAKTVFQANCGSRYKDANGNVTGNSPWRMVDYFQRTKRFNREHYHLVPPKTGSVGSKL